MAHQPDALIQRKKAAFIAAFAECGNITQAAKIAKIERASHYRWLEDAEYKGAFDAAQEQAVDALEQEARRRALHGVDEPVFYKGMECGAIRKYSDTLLIFLLKGLKPAMYRDNLRAEISGPDGGPIESVQLAPEDVAKLYERYQSRHSKEPKP